MKPFAFTVTLAQVNGCDAGRACQHEWTSLGVLRCLHLAAALEKGHFIPQRMQKLLKKRLSTGAVHRNALFLNLPLLLQTVLAAVREDILMFSCNHLNKPK